MATRPQIIIGTRRVEEMADRVRAAIEAVNQPRRMFGRADDMVRVVAGGDGSLLVRPFDAGAIKAEAEKAVLWDKPHRGGTVPARVPQEVVDFLVHADPIWPELPYLRRLVHAPVILPDARILAISGYDPDTQLYLALERGFVLPPVPDDPTEDDLMRSSALVQSYLDEFVFAEAADAANALGMFIGHLLRPLLGDEALLPMFDIDAPTQATGKTALANATGMLALGSAPKIVPEIKDADEMRKQVTSMLVGESELMLFDNLTQRLDDASLAAALTGEGVWGGRLLGTNNLANARQHTTFIATGNNLQIGPDLRRRSVYIRLDTNMADPGARRFRRTDFLGSLKAARPSLLAAVFTWVRRWLQQGSPSPGAPIMVGYNPFVRAINGLLRLVGLENFLGNLHSFRQSQDPEMAVWERWLAEWYRLWEAEPQPTGDLARALNNQLDRDLTAFGELRPDELHTYTQVDRDKLSLILGQCLHRHMGRVFGEYKLVQATRRDGFTRWRVITAQEVGSVGSVGSDPEPSPPIENIPVRVKGYPTDPTNPTDPTENQASRTRARKVSQKSVVTKGNARPLAEMKKPAVVVQPTDPLLHTARAHDAREVDADKRTSLWEVLQHAAEMRSVDTETFSDNPDPRAALHHWLGAQVRIISFADERGAHTVDWPSATIEQRLAVQRTLADPNGPLLPMHNARFDLTMLRAAGLQLPPMRRVFDTMLAAQLLDASSGTVGKYGLDDLAERYLGISMDKTLQTSDWGAPDISDEQYAYAARDAEVTWQLAQVLGNLLVEADMEEVFRIEMEFLAFTVALEFDGGLPVDTVAWMSMQVDIETERLGLEERLSNLYAGKAPKRWSARTWLQNYIREQGYLTGETADGKPTISAAALEEYRNDPLIDTYLRWKLLDTRNNGWGESYLQQNVGPDHCFHGDYRQLGTRTGRLSCSKPNLQQIPKSGGLREAIHPKAGRCFIKADYSQLQLVIIADESLDPVMCAAYDPKLSREDRRKAEHDLHTTTAKNVLGLKIPDGEKVKGAHRTVSKNINFGLCYGVGAGRLASMIERETGEECDIEIARMRKFNYFKTYSGVKHWHGLRKHLSAQGLAFDDEEHPNPIEIRTRAGRRRSEVWKFTEKVNSPIQMREADGVKTGLALLVPRLQKFHDARPVMMIHDEVIVECDIAEAEAVRETIEQALEEGMNRWLEHTTATVEAEIVRNYAGDAL